MFKKGDVVVAIKHANYDDTDTERLHGYVREMRALAEGGKEFEVDIYIAKDYVKAGTWNWHESDLALVEEEN